MKIYIFILFVLSLGIFTIFGPDSFYGRGDILWYFLNTDSIENSKYIITKNDFGGINQTSLYYFIGTLTNGLSQNFVQIFLYFLLTFLKLILTFLFFINLGKFSYKNLDNKKTYFYSFLVTVFFIFNSYVLQKYFFWSFSVYQLFIPILFFIFWFIIKKNILYKRLIFGLILISLLIYAPFLLTNPPYVLLSILLLFFLLIFNLKKIDYKRLLFIFFIIILICLPFLYNYTLLLFSSGDINTATGSSWFWTHRNSTLIKILQGQGPWSFNSNYFNYFNYFNTFYYKILFSLTVIFSFLLLAFKKKYIKILFILLILLFFVKGIQKPFGFVYSYFVDNLPLFFLFRESMKFYIILLFIICITIFLSLFELKNKKIHKGFIIIILILISLNIYPFFNKNYFIGGNQYTDNKKTIFTISDNIKKYDKFYNDKRTILLPVSPSYVIKYNFNFIGTEAFENRFYNGEIINSPDGYLYNQKLKSQVNNLYLDICNIDLLNKLGINQIIYRNYVTMLSDKNDDMNNKAKKELGNCELFNKKYSDDNIIVYELKNIKNKNLVKINNINYILKFLNIKNDIKYSFLNTFNPNWKLYLKNTQGLFTPPLFENTHKKIYDYANSWTISKQEIIDYVNKHYKDELKKEGYPKKLDNGQIDYKYYKLNSDGSIDVELTLYFKPQLYFYIGLIISASTFILLILWLIVDSVKNRRKRKVEAN